MRDKENKKDLDYFNKLYESDSDDIIYEESSLKKIISEKGENYEKLPFCYMCLAIPYFKRLYLGYSMGKKFEELLPDAEKFVENACNGWNGKNYEDLVYICSISIIFNIRNTNLEKLLKKAEARQNDSMYGEMFIKLIEPSWEIKSEKTYYDTDKALVEVINLSKTDKTLATQRLKNFVEKEWFKNLYEGLISREGCYRGFWCIEAAALVKALKLDDASLKDSKYYPYDMAHFCN